MIDAMGRPVPLVLGAAIAAFLGSLLAGVDAAANALPEGRLQALAADEKRGAPFRRYLENRERITARWLAGRLLAISACAAFVFRASQGTPLGDMGPFVPVLIAVGAYGALAEVFTSVGRRRPELFGAALLRYIEPLEWIASPLAMPLAWLGALVVRSVPVSRPVDAALTEREVSWVVTEGQKTGAIPQEPAEIIRNVLEFKDVTTRVVMVPRRRMSAIEITTPLARVVDLVAADGHSRYPVYKENVDNVVGLLYVKDLFTLLRERRLESTKLADIVRAPVLFVAETQTAASVLREMRARRLHMAIVVDEFGGTSGLVTLEDILEEIVGDIRDEYDTEADAQIQRTPDGRLVADAAMSLADLAHHVGGQLPMDGQFESLGGLLVHRAGRVPTVGATLNVNGLQFIVREADEKRVVKVEIIPVPPDHEAEGEATVPQPS